jgi:Peptidase_C39 like family
MKTLKLACMLLCLALIASCRKDLAFSEMNLPPNNATVTASADRAGVLPKLHTRSLIESGTPPPARNSMDPLLTGNPDDIVSVPGATARNINKFGMWLWYIQGTGYASHSALADKLLSMNVKRIYVKVADGGYNPTAWPEVDNPAVVNAYKSRGIEVWAWAYNYPGNETAQAQALYQAAKAGYQGFVTDIEIEFDRTTTSLTNIFTAFVSAKNRAIADGFATSAFKLYCTTWGNPKDHGMRVDIIDQYVDGHMPQTYVEVWGSTYMANAASWVNAGTQEYRSLGCTKPVHHIVSAEKGIITSAQINSFMQASGAETSVWRVPGGGTPLSIWTTLEAVNWVADFGTASTITLNVPGVIQAGLPTTFTGTASAGVTTVKAMVDGFAIGSPATVSGGNWSLPYTFSSAGLNRVMVVKGYNASNAEVASVTQNINVNASGYILTATMPASITTGTPARFNGTASSGITKVQLSADGFSLGEATVSNGTWTYEYTFNTTGANRVLTLKGLSSTSTLLTTKTYNFTVTGNLPYLQGMPYFYQYSNTLSPSGTCQNTSMAMILKYFAIKEGKTTIANQITPDDLTSYWGSTYAQTVPGFVDQFNRESAFRTLKVRDNGSSTIPLATFRTMAASGKPYVVHGYFTPPGHIMVVLGFDGTYYYCNDPAGKWNQLYAGSGYSGANTTEGIGIKYRKDAFEQAISPDGKVWVHDFYQVP